MTTGELSACPFCGGKPELVSFNTFWAVVCECEAKIRGERYFEQDADDYDAWESAKQSVIAQWNRRAPALPAELVERIKLHIDVGPCLCDMCADKRFFLLRDVIAALDGSEQ